MAEITLDCVSKVYPGSIRAVQDFSLTVADGELVVLVGPSGCGKSTILRMIAGLESVTAGQIHIGGRPATHLAPADRNLAMVFQSSTLYPHLSVRENLAFGLRFRRNSAAQIAQRIQEAANVLELNALLDRQPDELSGGQQQRVALGRVLVRRPSAFLLDEPLSDLDPSARSRLRTEILALHRRLQTTMVYVTHDQAEAMLLGQRVVVLRNGVTQQIDAPLHVYERPANRFVAEFLGEPAMNLFPAQIAQGNVLWQSQTLLPAVPLPNGPVIVGIRPENLALQQDRDMPAPCWRGTVSEVQRPGYETLVHVEIRNERLLVRCPPQSSVEPGQACRLILHPERLHLFSADSSGRRLN